MRLTKLAQDWLAEILNEGDTVVDATLGNGADALFLTQHIGESGQLFGFDIQHKAIQSSTQLLHKQSCKQTFFCQGHEKISSLLPAETHGHIKAIMFNLGWLPGSDKRIITHASTTISALEQGLNMLVAGGRISVILYPGHQGGDTEAQAIMLWLTQYCSLSDAVFNLEIIEVPHRPTAPILLKIEKRL